MPEHSAALPAIRAMIVAVIVAVLIVIRLCRRYTHIGPRSSLRRDRCRLGEYRRGIRIRGSALSERRSLEAQQAPARDDGCNEVSPHGLTPHFRCGSALLVALLRPGLAEQLIATQRKS